MSFKNAQIVIDYCVITISLSEFLPEEAGGSYNYLIERVLSKLLFTKSEIQFKDGNGARYRYKTRSFFGGISIYHGGKPHFTLEMSGTGCRYWETLNPQWTWLNYFKYLKQNYRNLSYPRVDVACDTFDELNISLIQEYTMKGKYASTFRSEPLIQYKSENSVIFGSRHSNERLRIYDKTKERLSKIKDVTSVPTNWVRCEFQFRDEKAESFVSKFIETEDIGKIYFGHMHECLRFFSKFDGHHYERALMARWWKSFLQGAERIKLPVHGGLEYNLETLKDYLFIQTTSSFKTYLIANDGDVSKLLHCIGESKLNLNQETLLRQMGKGDRIHSYANAAELMQRLETIEKEKNA